ncbi:hypothetical protein TVAG_278580 [Trichomonas vaginalis G3]|uniref:Bap-like n=1 Tax=Trichomonas vaginalis (strain ATCC PRA-98 / G3) TaxID=412133 RepID=A2DU99_TRIV3|nr:hypothetical protein TVAGG3_0438020 [Trichomonas vaginalis G3]EAY16092.1 hypothetical protein TVAG_278580 [Trichomonas vaginalis G3]KAI5537242.1 hypothetical protein TVAGG3_0438020 [Trichomonas vaginalis G3]|eukprot:XP_001328315.1 hypothetical protein [Trichomonas vaginalis G3]
MDTGVNLKMIVDGEEKIPKNLDKDPFHDIVFDIDYNNFTENDLFVKYIFTNTGSKPHNFSFGTYTDINFNGENFFDGNCNEVYPVDNKIVSVICNQTGKEKQKLFLDHGNYSEFYTMPDNFWYGSVPKDDPRDKYFLKFDNYNDLKVFLDPVFNAEDVETSYSWNPVMIQPGQTIIYGMRYFFMMNEGFELITATPSVPIAKGETAAIHTYMRILEKGKNYSVYQKNGDAEYSLIRTFEAKRPLDRWIFYYKDTTGQKTTVLMKIVNKNDNKSTNELAVEVPISNQKPGLILTTTGAKELYRNNESINLGWRVTGDSNYSIVFELYRNTQVVKTEKIPIELNSTHTSNTSSFLFPLDGLRSEKYNLKVFVENDLKLRNNFDYTKHFVNFTILSETNVTDLKFNKSYVLPRDKIVLTGKFYDLDTTQMITFHVKIGSQIFNSSTIQAREENQEFSINITVPEIISEKITCRVWSTDQVGTVSFDGTLPLTITERPKVRIETNITDNTISYNNWYKITVTITDDNNGTISLKLGETIQTHGYTTDKRSATAEFILEPKDIQNHKFENNPHTMKIVATDTDRYSVSDEQIKLNVTNKPIIEKNGIILPERSDPKSSVAISINYTDYDEGKTLYVYAINEDGETISFGNFRSEGKGNAIATYKTTYPSFGRYQYQFFLSSRSGVNTHDYDGDNVEFSNQIKKALISTEKPTLKLTGSADDRYGSNDTITIELTIEDDNNGRVIVYVDNNLISIPDASYTVSNGKGTKEISLLVRGYSSEKGNENHTVDIHVKDNFNVESNHVNFTFQVVNVPVIQNATVTPELLRSDIANGMNVSISVTVMDQDKGKDLYFYIKEKENKNQNGVRYSLKDVSRGEIHTYYFNYTVKSNTIPKLPLVIWVEDDNNTIEDFKYGESSPITVYVNVTEAPKMIASCYPTTIGRDEEIMIATTVYDDTKGTIHFTLNEKDLTSWDFEYEASNGVYNKTQNFTFTNPMEYGNEYNLVFYPVDEYGVHPFNSSSVKTCKLTYKNKPEIQNPQLTQLQADNDEIVNVTGTLMDYDRGKMLYIFQKIENQSPLKIGQINSTGSSQTFNLPLANLINQKSGNRSITIWATDNEDSSIDNGRNSKSDLAQLYIYMANDPNISITIPDNIYQKGEKFNVTIEVIADLSGTIYIKDETEINPDIGSISFSGNQTINKTLSFDRVGRHFLRFKAYGQNNTNSSDLTAEIFIRYVPKLNSISLDDPKFVYEPGDKVIFNIDFLYDATGYLYMFGKVDNYPEIYENNVYVNDIEDTSGYFPLMLPDTLKPGYHNVTIWLQNIHYIGDNPPKYTRSEPKTIKVLCSTAPKIDVDFDDDDIYGYDDEIKITVRINDDGINGKIKFLIDNYLIREVNYSITTRPERSSDYAYEQTFLIKIPRGVEGIQYYENYTFPLTVEVYDEYSKFDTREKYIAIINKPKVYPSKWVLKNGDADLQNSGSSVLPTDTLTISGSFDDEDYGKILYLHYKLNNYKTYRTTGKYVHSDGIPNQNFSIDFPVPQNQAYKVHGISFFFSMLENPNSETHKNVISEDVSKAFAHVRRPDIAQLRSLRSLSFSANDQFYLISEIKAINSAKILVTLLDSRQNKTFELRTQIVDIDVDNKWQKINLSYTVPEGLSYGIVNVTQNVMSYGYYPEDGPEKTYFTYKNKISIDSLNIENPKKGYVRSQKIQFQGVMNDKDKHKPIYYYYRIGGSGKFNKVETDDKPTQISNGEERQNISFSFIIDSDLRGSQKLEIFASDLPKYNSIKRVLDKSNVIEYNITLTDVPVFGITPPTLRHYQYNTTIEFNTSIIDDTLISLKGYIDNSILVVDQNISVVGKLSGKIQVPIPQTLEYGYHSLQFYAIDEFDVKSSVVGFPFYLIHNPTITEVTIDPNWTRQNDSIYIKFNYDDVDKDKKMYVFVQIGDKVPTEHSGFLKSEGTLSQKYDVYVLIPADEPLGNKEVRIWLSNDENPMNNSIGAFPSNYGNHTIRVTFQPGIDIHFPSKTIYQNNEKIHLVGTASADSDLTFTYYVDDIPQEGNKVVKITKQEQELSESFTIPNDLMYGWHKLIVSSVDNNGLTSGSDSFAFYVTNVPKINKFTLSTNRIVEKTNLSATVDFFDHDFLKEVMFYIQFNEEKPILIKTIESKGEDDSLNFSFNISDLAIGNHSITIYIKDSENHTSYTSMIAFEIIKYVPQEENKPSGTSGSENSDDTKGRKDSSKLNKTGLIVGVAIVAVILVILIIVATILMIKKKKASQGAKQFSSESGSELEETHDADIIESTITNIIGEEATLDNPVFVGGEIADDSDLFNDHDFASDDDEP